MKMKIVIFVLLVSTTLAACSSMLNSPSADLLTAQDCLESFFSLLSFGAYEQAVLLYGGSYEELRSMNPAIPADGYAAFWENACTTNGFQCLPIRQVLQAKKDDSGIFHFLVEFKTRDGGLLVLGPCCGADATQMPPRSQFEFSVIRRQGKFLVQELPVFVP
jgi:hypothetical protein